MLGLLLPVSAKDYNVKDFGAVGDGKTLDHHAINAAIDSCVAQGGGRVVLPTGTYLCGSIRLKSHVELHLSAGAKILAAPAEMKAYDEAEEWEGPAYQDGGHTYFKNSLIYAIGQENVSITGRGMIDGEGLTRRDTERAGNLQGGNIGTGDKAIALKSCRNILIRDVTIFQGGHFAIILTGCDLGTVDNVTIDTNRDGIDIDCCKYLTVSNCKINTPHDDALVLKSSYALKKPVVTEHIAVTNCIITGYKFGSLLDGSYVPEPVNWVCGRFKLGTESNGGYRNISLSNCTFMYSSGLAFEVVDQGLMENITVSNITMNHVHHYPIYITTGCRNRGPKERTDVSTGRDIMISNVVANDVDSLAGIIVTGMPGAPLRNISLSNIQLLFRGGGKAELADQEYREQGTNYPEPKFAKETPAYGLFARHVDGLDVHHVTFRTMKPDYRPAVMLDDVQHHDITNLKADLQQGVEKIVVKKDKAVDTLTAPIVATPKGKGNAPFFYSVKVPDGNYKVTVVLGAKKKAGKTVVRAENRRLMLDEVATKKGEFKTFSFIVNKRTPYIDGAKSVKIKPREKDYFTWDDLLTLEFAGAAPTVEQVRIEPDTTAVTLFLCGNSTVVDQANEPYASWGQMITRWFDPEVAVSNHAESGLATSSFLASNRLDKVLAMMKPGDYVICEFGHNDQKEKSAGSGAWYNFSSNLKIFIDRVRAKGGHILFATPTQRRSFDEATHSKIQETHRDYPEAMRAVAQREGVPVIELHDMTRTFFETLGYEGSKQSLVHYPANTFPGQTKALADNTHFNPYGAYEVAKMVVMGMKQLQLPFVKYLRSDWKDYDPAQPDDPAQFVWYPSVRQDATKPDGN